MPLSLTGGLPARLERDGTLRVQVRAGSHEIFLYARGTDVAQTLARPETAPANGRAKKSGALPPTTRCASPPRKAPRASIPRRPTCPANGASIRLSAWTLPRS